MGISTDDIASVRAATDIVAVISEHVQLKRVGRRWQGLCPFHSEKSGSFSVNAEEKLYYCFGCGAKGDVITFVREIEHVDFVGAVEKLAARAGIALRYTDEGENEGRKRRKMLLGAVGRAVDWYHERLLSAPDAAAARGYLRSRGLTGDEVRAYKVGWAPEGWDALARALRLPDDVFVEAGLGYLNDRHSQTDAFRGRVLFPIYDVNGDAVGFGGRIMPGATGAKYKNSADSTIYNKSNLLYGLNWAKADIVRADEAIVCEGYTDVIGFAKAGVPRAVATCGTALTEQHVQRLRSFARRLVLAFDADAAGQNAADRVYAWERAHGLDVAVAALPGGVDPADLAQTDPEALAAAVAGAKPFLKFRLDRVLDAAPLDTPEQRARAAEAAVAVVAEHPSELVRDQYLLEVAARCRIDPDRLRAGTGEGGRAPGQGPGGGRGPGRGPRGRAVPSTVGRRPTVQRDTAETEALRLLLARPDDIAAALHPALFADPTSAAAYGAVVVSDSLAAAVDQLHQRDDELSEAAADLLQRLAVEDTDAPAHDVLGLLVVGAASRALAAMKAEVRTADDPLQLSSDIAWISLRIDEARGDASKEVAIDELLGWLTGHPEEEG
jgi:DNA primase